MARTPTKKLLDVKGLLSLEWEAIPPTPQDTCDACGGPIYTTGHFQASSLRAPYVIAKVCRECGIAAGLKW